MPRKDDDKRIEPFYVQTSDIRFLREDSGEGFAIARMSLQASQAYIAYIIESRNAVHLLLMTDDTYFLSLRPCAYHSLCQQVDY